MKNTVLTENKKRKNLTIAVGVWFVFCILFVVMIVSFSAIGKQNLNGSISEKTITLSSYERDDIIILTDSDNLQYNVVCDRTESINWDDYLNKQITIVTPTKTFGNSNPWVLGIKLDDVVLVDHSATIESLRAENREIVMVVGILIGISVAVICALFIWRANTSATTERPLLHEYCEFLTPRQPVCKERKTFAIIVSCWGAAILISIIMIAISCSQAETFSEIGAFGIASLCVFGAVFVGGFPVVLVYTRIIFKKEIDFYAENLPFDLSDISHAPLRKAVKAQLQEEIKKDRELHPNTYGDGGNGFDVTFDKDGVSLTFPSENEIQQDSDANVFPELSAENEVFEGFGAPVTSQSAIRLSYERLNLEAVAHYRKNNHPMMVMIKSRIEDSSDLPEEFVNDLHIVLDINLLNTLKNFDVKVDNLDYLLENKKQLMLDNCFKRLKDMNKE